jgi:hypothetical protein
MCWSIRESISAEGDEEHVFDPVVLLSAHASPLEFIFQAKTGLGRLAWLPQCVPFLDVCRAVVEQQAVDPQA